MDALSAAAPDAIEIHPGTPNVYFETNCIKGEETAPIMDDPENVVVNMKGYSSRQPHLPLEPDVGFAYVDENGVLKIHSKSIGIHLHHGMICAGLGVEPDKCHLIQNHAGGTFGYKFSPTMEALLGVAAMATGKTSCAELQHVSDSDLHRKTVSCIYRCEIGCRQRREFPSL